MRKQEASTVARALVNAGISLSYCPANLHRDKGSNFTLNLFKVICKELGINRSSTTVYHPQGSAKIERTNRTIEKGLTKYVSEHQKTWSNHLPLVMMAYRSSIHYVNKYSPFYFLLDNHALCQLIACIKKYKSKSMRLRNFVGCLKDEPQTCN